jgi:rRNA-processing protein FCF1
MISLHSFRARLERELATIEASILDLWHMSLIEEFRNDPNSAVVFMGQPYYWKSLAVEHRASQAQLLARYQHWYELFRHCHSHHSSDVQSEIKETNDYVVSAIELNTGWQTERTVPQNQTYLSKKLGMLRRLLTQPDKDNHDLMVVPDTNALLRSAEPSQYGTILGATRFIFVIVPTVLSELDELKRGRRDQTLGHKAEKVINILKGFRAQGSVLEGVTVSKTITVKMIATEPRMAYLPSWLEPGHKDDRIIASVLEIQRANPSAIVVLSTGDINLQNKAEMAFLPWAEPPDAN